MKAALLTLCLHFSPIFCEGQPSLNFPVPDVPNQLFYLQRTPNINTVIYQLNLIDGKLDSIQPVHIFWIRYADNGQKEELTDIQRKLAYGLAVKKVEKEQYELRFLAKKDLAFVLKKGRDGQYHVCVTIHHKPIVLRKIYLHINGGTMFSPHIEYVIFYGADTETGEPVTEQIAL